MKNVNRLLVYGGRGALGTTITKHFKAKNWWVSSVDILKNKEADLNIQVQAEDSLDEQQKIVKAVISSVLGDKKLDAIICVAGGHVNEKLLNDFVVASEMRWKDCVCSSLICADIAINFLKEGGLLSLTGAKSALEPHPTRIGYGMAKEAVHHLVKSLASVQVGLPKNSTVVGVLPAILDTPQNRKLFPKGDYSTWTPLMHMASMFENWSINQSQRPRSGSLVEIVTLQNHTKITPIKIMAVRPPEFQDDHDRPGEEPGEKVPKTGQTEFPLITDAYISIEDKKPHEEPPAKFQETEPPKKYEKAHSQFAIGQEKGQQPPAKAQTPPKAQQPPLKAQPPAKAQVKVQKKDQPPVKTQQQPTKTDKQAIKAKATTRPREKPQVKADAKTPVKAQAKPDVKAQKNLKAQEQDVAKTQAKVVPPAVKIDTKVSLKKQPSDTTDQNIGQQPPGTTPGNPLEQKSGTKTQSEPQEKK